MIPNHPRFIEAIHEKKQVSVRFYSKADSGVVDRICAPLDYGPGGETGDDLNRYWFWDCATGTAARMFGLVPEQIVELSVLGEGFDPGQLGVTPPRWFVPREWGVPPPPAVPPASPIVL